MIANPIKRVLAKLPPMPTSPPTHEPHRATLLQLATLIFVAVVLHFKIADARIATYALVIFAIKAIIIIRTLAPPPKFIMMILTIASLALVLFIYGGWNGQIAGISFIVLLVALKFLESHALRDYFVVCLLLYFLAASSFLFDSSIASISIIVVYALGITGILFQISNPTPMPFKQTLKSSLGIVAKALPLAVLLFFFFPRISGDFGFLPSQDQRDTEGLSDALVAGEMAAGAFNNELAFRVEFKDGVVPPNSQLYWRAKTMPTERNFVWEVGQPEATNNSELSALNAATSLANGDWFYSVLHENSSDDFLPYLDYVAGVNRGYVLRDYSVTRRRTGTGSFSYKGSSSADQLLVSKISHNTESLLSTESKPTARLQALLSSIRSKSNNDAESINRLYQYFLDRPYKYSLAPPGLDEFTPLDDFIFNTRTGYCEHYASAFTTLARWLGVPARVVVGYQGGTQVNGGQYLEVRYSDAHAWSEVWVNDQWQRVDATAAVRPDRIEFGMDALRELWDLGQFDNGNSSNALANFLNPTGTARLFRDLRDTWKNVGYQWNKWVVNYDIATQRELLETLGFKHKNGILTLVLIMMLGAFAMLLLYFWQLIPKQIKRSKLQAAYLHFVTKFKRHGLEKNISDTPAEFASKASALFPQLEQTITQISNQFQALRYRDTEGREEDNAAKIDAFVRQVKQFKISVK